MKFTYFFVIFLFHPLPFAWWGNTTQNLRFIVLSRVHLVHFGILGGGMLWRPPMDRKPLPYNLITQEGRLAEVLFFPPPLILVCLHHITLWHRMKRVQVSVWYWLGTAFGCHHWHVTALSPCLLGSVNGSWVSEITVSPVECACGVCTKVSPLRQGDHCLGSCCACIPWICEINREPSNVGWGGL